MEHKLRMFLNLFQNFYSVQILKLALFVKIYTYLKSFMIFSTIFGSSVSFETVTIIAEMIVDVWRREIIIRISRNI